LCLKVFLALSEIHITSDLLAFGAARRWLEKEPPRSIHTWEDLFSKFINEFVPSSRTTNLRNEISNFQQRFDESFHEAWDRYKDLLRACPHHGFTELHQLDTFYNALNPADQDSLNAAAAAVNYNQGNFVYLPLEQSYQVPTQQNQNVPLNELEKVKRVNEANMKATQTRINMVKNELRNEMKNSIQASMSNQTNEIKNMMASLFQMNFAFTSGSGSLPSKTIANPNALLSNKEKLQQLANTPLNENCSAVILKKLPKKLRDPGKFLISCGFSELKYKALADLANRAIFIPVGIARDVFVSVGKFTFLANFVIVDYESDLRVPLILGKPFLRTARALIDVHGEEIILHDGDKRLTLNMRHGTSTYSNQLQKESINLINVFNNSKGGNVLPEKLLDLDSTKDLHPPLHNNTLSGSTTYSYSPNPLLEELADELALITFSLKYDDDLYNLANPVDNFVDFMPEMFTDEHALDYSSPPIFDEYDEDFLEIESDTENVYDDPFDSKGEEIKDFKLLIDELDLPCDFLLPSEYDSFISQDFSKVDAFPSTNNEDKIFNPGILIEEKPFEIITRVVQDKKLATSNASSILKDFDPPFYEPLFVKELPKSKMLLPFSSKNEEKVFKSGIHTSEKVHSSFIPELFHQGYKVFKINQIFKSPMKMFFSPVERTPTSWLFLVSIFTPLISSSIGELDLA
nr:reverse transcriptase domain-containing protein [Tanacetum cinerariifolium]